MCADNGSQAVPESSPVLVYDAVREAASSRQPRVSVRTTVE